MPEVIFTVQLPDGSQHRCYSPSSVVRDFFAKGETIAAADFLKSSRAALTEASERVRAKYGFHCTAASASLEEIEHWASRLPAETPLVIAHI